MGFRNKIVYLFEMIRLEHTLFSLPFLYIGAFLADYSVFHRSIPQISILVLITIALFTGRITAMVANRIIDANYDQENPRTRLWHIPSGKLSKKDGEYIVLISTLLFFTTVYFINITAFLLSFLVIPLFIFYSFLKRYTYLSHLGLGIIEGIVPVGGWIAVTGNLDSIFSPVLTLIFISVVLWEAGFDILYSMQDVAYDVKAGLNSIPAKFGIKNGMRISFSLHILMGIMLSLLMIWLYRPIFLAALIIIWLLIIYEHSIVTPEHLEKINFAFFNINVAIGFTLFAGIIAYIFS